MRVPFLTLIAIAGALGCSSSKDASTKDRGQSSGDAGPRDSGAAHDITGDGSASARLPLVLVADVDLPGGATRFDYQDVDRDQGHLVVTHMNDGSVLFLSLSDGSVLKEFGQHYLARFRAGASARQIFEELRAHGI